MKNRDQLKFWVASTCSLLVVSSFKGDKISSAGIFFLNFSISFCVNGFVISLPFQNCIYFIVKIPHEHLQLQFLTITINLWIGSILPPQYKLMKILTHHVVVECFSSQQHPIVKCHSYSTWTPTCQMMPKLLAKLNEFHISER